MPSELPDAGTTPLAAPTAPSNPLHRGLPARSSCTDCHTNPHAAFRAPPPPPVDAMRAPPPPPPPVDAMRAPPPPPSSYRVRAGDSFARIAQRFYRAPDAAESIRAANPGIDPRRIAVGQELRLPPVPGATPPPAAPAPDVDARLRTLEDTVHALTAEIERLRAQRKLY
jgi:hypothetical protein